MAAEHDRMPEIALDWHRAGKGAVLGTVIQTWGSAPRPVGAQIAISGEGEIMGSVSGGCVEGAVVAEALEALSDGRCRVLEFGVSDDDAFAVGLACGGTIRVAVEPVAVGAGIAEDDLATLVARRAAREGTVVVTHLDTWAREVVPVEDRTLVDPALGGAVRADRSAVGEDGRFVHVHNPPLRLIVVGGVHIAQPLCEIAGTLGYDIAIVDPREAFASAARFPGRTLRHDWPDEALMALGVDHRTAVVTLTHDPKLDDPALSVALASPAFYIGALGSTRTHAKRVARLTEAGVAEAEIARIDAPVGLDLGAKSPAEIAVSIAGAMTAALRRPPALAAAGEAA